MTREELIRYGNDYYRDLVNACCGVEEKHKEFVRESIKALEQQPITTTNNDEPITVIYPTIVGDDAISREAAIKTVHKMRVVCDTEDIDDYYELLVESFKQLPPVTQKYGKWIKSLIYENTYNCSKCGSAGYGTFKYCPNCGAKMQESEDKE